MKKRSLQSTERVIAHEKATYAQKVLAEDQAVAGPLHDQRSENDEVPNLEQVIQEGEEQVVSLQLLRARNYHRENMRNFERLFVFLSTVSETVTSDSECLVCMNELGSQVVSMFPCLHFILCYLCSKVVCFQSQGISLPREERSAPSYVRRASLQPLVICMKNMAQKSTESLRRLNEF